MISDRKDNIIPIIMKKLIPFGYTAAVYTQTTDVEGEVNGLITYDRKVVKMDEAQIRKINREICNALSTP